MAKFILKIVLNAGALYAAEYFFSGFILTGGLLTFTIGALFLALLFTLLRPLLKILFIPLVWITFGLFNIVISIFLLWIADAVLAEITITNFQTLFWVSFLFAIVNSFF